jgi:hypothetical protein
MADDNRTVTVANIVMADDNRTVTVANIVMADDNRTVTVAVVIRYYYCYLSCFHKFLDWKSSVLFLY